MSIGLILSICFGIICFIAWWMEETSHSKTVKNLLDTERKHTQALLEMKAMRTLCAKDAQELIKHRAFKRRFDEITAERKKNEG